MSSFSNSACTKKNENQWKWRSTKVKINIRIDVVTPTLIDNSGFILRASYFSQYSTVTRLPLYASSWRKKQATLGAGNKRGIESHKDTEIHRHPRTRTPLFIVITTIPLGRTLVVCCTCMTSPHTVLGRGQDSTIACSVNCWKNTDENFNFHLRARGLVDQKTTETPPPLATTTTTKTTKPPRKKKKKTCAVHEDGKHRLPFTPVHASSF